MAGSFDDIIREVMSGPKGWEGQEDIPFYDYPTATARVPPDKVRDTPYVEYFDPNVYGGPAELANAKTNNRNLPLNKVIRRAQEEAELPDDLAAMILGMERRQKLGRGE